MTHKPVFDVGDECPACKKDDKIAHFEYVRQDDCRCHEFPPCPACVDAPLICEGCGIGSLEVDDPMFPAEDFLLEDRDR